MSDAARIEATLASWRAHGTDGFDPLRFALIDALARRAAARQGTVRELLDKRLAMLIDDYARDAARSADAHADATRAPIGDTDRDALAADNAGRQAAARRPDAHARPSAVAPAAGPLAHLAERLSIGTASLSGTASATVENSPAKPAAPHGAPHRTALWPDPEPLDYFRKLWAELSTDRQLQQSFDQVPTNAGPLNSSSLVHRSLALMREVSPGYLQQFLSYVDTLSWLEQLNGAEFAPPGPARANTAPKPAALKAAAAKTASTPAGPDSGGPRPGVPKPGVPKRRPAARPPRVKV